MTTARMKTHGTSSKRISNFKGQSKSSYQGFPEDGVHRRGEVTRHQSPSEEQVVNSPECKEERHEHCQEYDSVVECFQDLSFLCLTVLKQVRQDQSQPRPVVRHANRKNEVNHAKQPTNSFEELGVDVVDVPVVCTMVTTQRGLLQMAMPKKNTYVRMLNTKKKGFRRLDESASSSITIRAKKQMKNENAVKKSRLGSLASRMQSQQWSSEYLVPRITRALTALTASGYDAYLQRHVVQSRSRKRLLKKRPSRLELRLDPLLWCAKSFCKTLLLGESSWCRMQLIKSISFCLRALKLSAVATPAVAKNRRASMSSSHLSEKPRYGSSA